MLYLCSRRGYALFRIRFHAIFRLMAVASALHWSAYARLCHIQKLFASVAVQFGWFVLICSLLFLCCDALSAVR